MPGWKRVLAVSLTGKGNGQCKIKVKRFLANRLDSIGGAIGSYSYEIDQN